MRGQEALMGPEGRLSANYQKIAVGGVFDPTTKMLPEPILTVSTRVSRYQVQSKTSLHLTSSLPRTWHLPFCPKNECAGFRVHGGKNNAFSSMGGSPFKFSSSPPRGVTPGGGYTAVCRRDLE